MTREQVQDVVMRYIADSVDDVDVSSLEGSRSMKDYGINSLDIVEVVSRSMRELKVKVPRSELSTIQNIDGLVDVLHKAVKSRAAAHPEVR